jgi:hypothetical protein
MQEWYIQRGAEQYGPYSWEQLAEMAAAGRLLPSDALWRSGAGQWRQAADLPGLFPAHGAPPLPARPPRRKNRGFGCLGCLAGLLLSLLLCVAGSSLALYWNANRDSDNLAIGRPVSLATATIDVGGGSVVVNKPGQALHNLTIDIPPDAYDRRVSFTIQAHEITGHKLGPYFNPVTPLIAVDNGGDLAGEPMLITIPVNVAADQFALAFYYDRRTGALEGLTPVEVRDGEIVAATRRFSDIVVSAVQVDELSAAFAIDTGFRPGYDDWQFPNHGSYVAPRGHCAGQAISALWYFYERRTNNNARPLYGRYDNNGRYGTIDFWEDDSWGIRLSSVVQQELNWAHPTRRMLLDYRGHNDPLTWMAFGYVLLLTRKPQYVGIASSTSGGAHAIIVYRMDQDGLYVADPNYPGQERRIAYRDGRFEPYHSGASATIIAAGGGTAYDKIGYFPLTRWVDWEQIGQRWAELENGQVGDDYFDGYLLVYRAGEAPGTAWTPLEDVLVTDEAETAKPGAQYQGKLRVTLRLQNARMSLYRGTDLVDRATVTPQNYAGLTVDLQDGVNDLGFLVEMMHQETNPTTGVIHLTWEYVDFRRVTVIYNSEDITGEWQGHFVIDEADKLTQFVEDVIVSVIMAPGVRDLLEGLSGAPIDEAKAREAARAGITTPGVGVEIPLAVQIDECDEQSGRCRVQVAMLDHDGSLIQQTARGNYREGVLTFSFSSPEGFTFKYEGRLAATNRLAGSFTADALRLVSEAMSGRWQLERME